MDKDTFKQLLAIQSDSLKTNGKLIVEVKLLREEFEGFVASLAISKWLIRLIVFQTIVIAALAGIEVSRLAGLF